VHIDRRPSDSQPQNCGGGTEASRVSTVKYPKYKNIQFSSFLQNTDPLLFGSPST